MTDTRPTVRLRLESRAQTLTIVRGMLGGVAELLEIDPELLDDLKTSVSEACNNVVLHAYGGEPGPMEVALFVDDDRLRVVVADQGVGMAAPPAAGDLAQGIGLSVVRALAETVEFRSAPGDGTEVEMGFAGVREGRTLFHPPPPASPDDRDLPPATEGDVVVSLSPIALLPGVLGRLARTLAAGAHFSLDRFSDVYLVTDTLAAHAADAASSDRVHAVLRAKDRRLELELEPFRPGSGSGLGRGRGRSDEQPRSPLSLLADEIVVEPDAGHGEGLRVVVVDHRR